MKAVIRFKGGPGSGNHGHKGRPGLVGGSTNAGSDIRIPKGFSEDETFEYARYILHRSPGQELPTSLNALDAAVSSVIDPQETFGKWAVETNDKIIINRLINDPSGILTEADRPALEKIRELASFTNSNSYHPAFQPYKIVIEGAPKQIGMDANLTEWGFEEYSIRPVDLSAAGWWDIDSNGWTIHVANNSGLSNREVFWHEFGHTLSDYVIEHFIGKPLDGELSGEYMDRFAAHMSGKHEKGGPGSGNHGHAGRPGKVGGSLPAGALSTDEGIRENLSNWYDTLQSRGPRKYLYDRVFNAIHHKYPDMELDEIELNVGRVFDAMALGEEELDYYNRKYDLKLSSRDKKRFLGYNARMERELDRRRYAMHTALTYHKPGSDWAVPNVEGPEDWQHKVWAEKVGLIGNSTQDAVDALNKHGISVGIPEGWEDMPQIHDALSTLVHLLEKEPIVRDVAERRLRRVRFESRGDMSFSAQALHDMIEVNLNSSFLGKYYGTGPTTWVHEIGHLSENDGSFAKWNGIFTNSKRASSYSWKSPMEAYAEAFTAYIADRSTYQDWLGEQFDYFDGLYGGLK